MFPHKFDRYRALGYIVRQIRKNTLGITQAALAKKSNVTQGTISRLENFDLLTDAADHGRKPVARDVFINTATRGLGLSHQEVETLLWLIDAEEFEPINTKKTPDSLSSPILNESDSSQYPPRIMRDRTLGLLKRAVELDSQDKEVKVQMLTGWEETHQVTFRQNLLRMENEQGQRLLISKYPSYLTAPQNVFDKRSRNIEKGLSPDAREQIMRLTEQRRRIFRETLKHYGERCIHSTESIKRYLRKDFEHSLGYEERRSHVENLIVLLKEYKHFEVGLAQLEPEMEFVIKCGWGASLRGTAREVPSNPNAVICGPLYIFWDNKTTVYSFVVDFEYAWKKIPLERRSKDEVIDLLEQLLK